MIQQNLFQNIDYHNDPHWIIKDYFNKINDCFFLDRINNIVSRIGGGDEYAGCEFPERMDYDGEPYEGVKCWYLEDEIIVSEEDFKKHLIFACKEYTKLHLKKKEEIEKILNHLNE